ncbi:hypothetical protein MMPV_003348 [Pyropia vietnamensis]
MPVGCARCGDDAAALAADRRGDPGGASREGCDAGRGVLVPPRRLVLWAERGAQQGDPLGPLLHAAALWLVLRRLEAEHPHLLVRAFHDDVVVVGPPTALPPALADADRLGRLIDAQLAPAKCVGWSPAGLSAPAGWPATWAAEGVTQFSVPLGSDAHVAAGVDALAEEQGRLSAAIAALPPAELQAQLLLLRLCSGPRPNYWLRALPLVWGARLAAAVDRDAHAAVLSALCDAHDSTATRVAVAERAALPPRDGGAGHRGEGACAAGGGAGVLGGRPARRRRLLPRPRRHPRRPAAVAGGSGRRGSGAAAPPHPAALPPALWRLGRRHGALGA